MKNIFSGFAAGFIMGMLILSLLILIAVKLIL